MKKRFLTLLLTIVLCLLVLPATAQAADPVSSGTIQDGPYYTYWKLHNDGSLVFTGNANMKDYSLTSTWDDFYTPWHYASEYYSVPITSIRIEGTFHSIGSNSFWGLKDVTSVTLSDSVWFIREGAFRDCDSLKSIVISKNVYSIGDLAFAYCDNLETVDIMSTGLTSLDGDAFNHCPKLKAINVPVDSENFSSVDGILFNKDKTALCKYPAAKPATSYTVPSTVTSVGDFSYAANLRTVILPEGLKYLSDGCFEYCTGLTSISIPDGVKEIPFNAFWGDYNLRNVTLPSTVTKIDTQAFYNCRVTSVTLYEGLTSIGSNAFYACNLSGNLIIPASVTSIGGAAFAYNSGITRVTVLSKNCTFGGIIASSYSQYPEVHGWKGSTAETYANQYSMTFSEHNPSNYIRTLTDPTCTTLGTDLYDGCNCGIETVVFVDKVPHALNSTPSGYVKEAATCKSPAMYKVKCDNCYYYSDDVTVAVGDPDPNGHKFSDGVCTYCGITGGSCGSSLYWTINDSKDTLTIYGSYYMYSYGTTNTPPWYQYRDSITTINMVSGESIGDYAFQDMQNLTQVNLPETLYYIYNSAFVNCKKLESITLPSKLYYVYSNAFQSCASLKSITLPKNITFVAEGAFLNCSKLETVVFEGNVTSIRNMAFQNCSSLKNITIPSTVTSIGDSAFMNCTSLTQVTIPSGVTKISYQLFAGCKNLSSVTIEGNVTTVSSMAFTGCFNLTEIELPATVTSIQESAFSMSGLTSFTFPEKVKAISAGVFSSCTKLKSVVIPAGVASIGDSAFSGCTAIEDVYFGGTSTAWEALSNRPAATRSHYETTDPEAHWSEVSVAATCKVPGYTKEVCACAAAYERNVVTSGSVDPYGHKFSNGTCTYCGITGGQCGETVWWTLDEEGLLTIYGSGDTKNYQPWYSQRESVLNAKICQGVTSIGNYAFDGCANMVSVSIPDCVTSIGDWAFANCSRLKSITLPDSVTNIGDRAFADCSRLKSITLPDSVTSIGSFTFYGCSSLASITIPDSVTSIGDRAISECSSLKSITLPDSVTSIGSAAFSDCSGLENITMPGSVTSIGGHAFFNCTSLKSITIPEGVTSIGYWTFSYCSSLKSITIPDSVTSIGSSAFSGCSGLEDVYYDGTSAAWSNLGDNRPTATRVHYETTEPAGHWTTETHEKTCTEDGYTIEVCGCATPYNRNKVKTEDKLNHDWQNPDFTWAEDHSSCKLTLTCGRDGCGVPNEVDCTVSSTSFPAENCTQQSYVTYTATYETYTDTETVYGAYGEHFDSPEDDDHICDTCDKIMNDCVDGDNKDHICNICGADCGDAHEAAEGSHNCDYCGKAVTTCEDKNPKDHACDICGEPYGDSHEAAEGSHNCDYCGKPVTTCEDKNPKDHKCDICGEPHGDPHEAAEGSHNCDYCGKPVTTCEDKNPKDHKCDYGCGKVFGTCDDADKNGKCDVCGAEVKDEDPKPEEPKEEEPKPEAPAPEIGVVNGTTRLAGANRLVTSYLVADQLKNVMGIEKFDAIIVASGATFADALPGSYLSAVKNAPILLTLNKDKYIAETQDYIRANLKIGGTVYILGGTSAVSAKMEQGLDGFNVRRVAGNDRFGTNLEILKVAGVKAGDEILVCTAKEYADSLSASATGKPILLVYKKLTDAQKAFLSGLNGNTFCVVGGTSAVSDSLAGELCSYGAVSRLAGKDRLETSTMVAEKYFDLASRAVIAYGWDFPDGLCGGSLAYAMDAPLILTHSKEKLYGFTAAYTTKAGISDGFVLGGDGLVSDAATRAIFGMASNSPISVLN